MIFFVEEEIENYERFLAWFELTVPQIEAVGGSVLVQGVERDNPQRLRLVMQIPDQATLEGLLGSPDFTAARRNAGVKVETTVITFLAD
jgi:hypothetical protein